MEFYKKIQIKTSSLFIKTIIQNKQNNPFLNLKKTFKNTYHQT